jgi:hypothetical protein
MRCFWFMAYGVWLMAYGSRNVMRIIRNRRHNAFRNGGRNDRRFRCDQECILKLFHRRLEWHRYATFAQRFEQRSTTLAVCLLAQSLARLGRRVIGIVRLRAGCMNLALAAILNPCAVDKLEELVENDLQSRAFIFAARFVRRGICFPRRVRSC